MAILLMFCLFFAGVFYLQKIFTHYHLLQKNDVDLKKVDFGTFFYSNYFSKKRLTVSLQLYSLRLINDNGLLDPDNDIPKINLFIRLTLGLTVSAAGVLGIGLLTGTIR